MLGASFDLESLKARVLELVGQRLDSLCQEALAHLTTLGNHARNALIGFRLKIEEGKVLQLPLDRAHAQAVGQRRVHVHCLARLEQTPILTKSSERSHVMQAVGKLDDNHANVARHGEKHLAQVERLFLIHAVDLDVREFGHAVDELGNSRAKDACHIIEGCLGIFHRIVKERGAHHIAVHIELGQDNGHLNRMVDIHLARAALLLRMLLGGKTVGTLDFGAIFLVHVLAAQARELVVAVCSNLIRQIIGTCNVQQLRGRAQAALLVCMNNCTGMRRSICMRSSAAHGDPSPLFSPWRDGPVHSCKHIMSRCI